MFRVCVFLLLPPRHTISQLPVRIFFLLLSFSKWVERHEALHSILGGVLAEGNTLPTGGFRVNHSGFSVVNAWRSQHLCGISSCCMLPGSDFSELVNILRDACGDPNIKVGVWVGGWVSAEHNRAASATHFSAYVFS